MGTTLYEEAIIALQGKIHVPIVSGPGLDPTARFRNN
jgi:hypothetical protein